MKSYILRANNLYTLVKDDRNPWTPCFWDTDIRTYRPIIFDSWEGAKAFWEYLSKCKEFYNMNRHLGEKFSIAVCELSYEKREEWEEEL